MNSPQLTLSLVPSKSNAFALIPFTHFESGSSSPPTSKMPSYPFPLLSLTPVPFPSSMFHWAMSPSPVLVPCESNEVTIFDSVAYKSVLMRKNPARPPGKSVKAMRIHTSSCNLKVIITLLSYGSSEKTIFSSRMIRPGDCHIPAFSFYPCLSSFSPWPPSIGPKKVLSLSF